MVRYQYDGRVTQFDDGLGYDPGGEGGTAVYNFRMSLDAFTRDSSLTMKSWGLDPGALRPEDHFAIDKLLTNYIAQEGRIHDAFRVLNDRAKALRAKCANSGESPNAIETFLADNLDWYQSNKAEKAEPAPSRYPRARSRYSMISTKDTYDNETGKEMPYHYHYEALAQPHIPYPPDGGRPKRTVPADVLDPPMRYTAQEIPLAELRELVNLVLIVQRQYTILAKLTNLELTRVVYANQEAFYYAKLKAAQDAASDGGAGLAGDILGIVAAVSGVLALIPVLTPIAGPIALLAAAGSLSAHVASVSIKGDWDKPGALMGLAADVLALVPGISAVAKSVKAARTTMVSVGRITIAARTAGRTFVAEVAGTGASQPARVFDYLGNKASVMGGRVLAGKGAAIGKVMQGSVNLSLQVPLAVELGTGTDQSEAKDAATYNAFVANYGQTIGNWGVIGTIAQKGAKKAGTVSLGLFAAAFRR